MNPVYAAMPTSIFEEMSLLARQHGAIDLVQGFPDAAVPEDIRAAARALIDGRNHRCGRRAVASISIDCAGDTAVMMKAWTKRS